METKAHTGLSPSSLSLYLSCPRKYYLKKIAKVAIDEDASEDTEAFSVGKAFHKVLEDTRHELSGIKYETVKATTDIFGLDPDTHTPMIYAMLAKYKTVHEKAKLKAIACELVIETPIFYGIVDVVLQGEDGSFFIGDMKTSAAFYSNIAATLPMHPQLNLYAYHANYVAKALGLDPDDYRGCRYRVTTKSKLKRSKGEETKAFIARLMKSVKSYDFILPHTVMQPSKIAAVHADIKAHIDANKETTTVDQHFPRNYGNCNQYFKSCEFWSNCHGSCNSKMPELEVVESD